MRRPLVASLVLAPLLFGAALPGPARADSALLRIKGRLTNAKGAQLTGAAPLTFRILDSAGREHWRDARVVSAASGEFFAELGSGANPLPLPGEVQGDWRLRVEPPRNSGWKVLDLVLDPRRTQLRQLLAQFDASDRRVFDKLDDPHPQLARLLAQEARAAAAPPPYESYLRQEDAPRTPTPLAALAPAERDRLLRLERVLRSERELLKQRLTRLAMDYERRPAASLPPRLIRIGVAVSAR
ncbi:MAG TPA: hypothetical protein DCM05_07335 [Elusimicrobia bacterium]|nr:hypothetical protein [Elusimicrobiota bacterium]